MRVVALGLVLSLVSGSAIAADLSDAEFEKSVLAAVGSPAAPAAPAEIKQDNIKKVILQARSAMDQSLNDWPSARFRNFRIIFTKTVFLDTAAPMPPVAPFTFIRGEPVMLVCGDINAKNAMGGYTGWQSVMVVGGTLVIAGDEPSETVTKFGTRYNLCDRPDEDRVVLNSKDISPLLLATIPDSAGNP